MPDAFDQTFLAINPATGMACRRMTDGDWYPLDVPADAEPIATAEVGALQVHLPVGLVLSHDNQRRAAAEVFQRAGTILDDDDALDAELLHVANRGGGSLVRFHLHGAQPPFSALAAAITLAAALREVLGFTSTPTPKELLTTTMAAGSLRPEVCPDCQEIGLCDHDCAAAVANGWAREATTGGG